MIKLYLFVLTLTYNSFSQTNEIKEVLTLFNFKDTKETKSIKTKSCEVDEKKWLMLLITNEPFIQKLEYNKNCDISGSIKVQYNKSFPLKLNIRNKDYKRLSGDMKIFMSFDKEPTANIEIQNAKLIKSDKKEINFNYKHLIKVDPFSKDIVKEDLGPQIKILN